MEDFESIIINILSLLKNESFDYEYKVLLNEKQFAASSQTEYIVNVGEILLAMIKNEDVNNIIGSQVLLYTNRSQQKGVSYKASKYYSIRKKVFEIDGMNFHTLQEFYSAIGEQLVENNEWGFNWNAFNDILRGGFIKTNYNEPFKLIWKNSDISKKHLNDYEDIISLINEHDNVELVLE